MSKWDSRFMDLARLVASWSKDPSTQVGAVIVDQDKRIVSTGFNGFPRSVNDVCRFDRNTKLLRTIHAEENALLFARRDVTGMSVYVTRPPCARCAAKLVQAGIVRVVYELPPVDFVERWGAEMREAQAMFDEVGMIVKVMGVDLDK
jgi:dCMP deaminase